ncbi:MAG: hypothetical protein ACI4OR_02425 [Alphaproteobacteria bacterium]
MEDLLKENSLLGIFRLNGPPDEQEVLNKLLQEVLNTKSGKQLVEDVSACDFVPKPIQLEFVSQEKLGRKGTHGNAHSATGKINLLKINPDIHLDFLERVCTLAHELYHLRNGGTFTPLLRKSSIAQQVYNHLTNEACTYAFQACVFEKELTAMHPEFKSNCKFSQKEFIELWMHGRINSLAQDYVNSYAETFKPWCPPVKKREFMAQMAPFQQRETALPLESFPWYKISKSGGYYIIGTKAVLEIDKQEAPIFRCIYVGNRKFKSTVYSRKKRKTAEGAFVPVYSLTTIAERPALPEECAQAQDYMAGKISAKDLKEMEEIKLPKEVKCMIDIVAWRESFVSDKPLPAPPRIKTNTYE